MAGIILSADIGTSSLKAAFIDLEGRLLAFSRTVYRYDAPPSAGGAYAWERAFASALECLYARAPDTGIDAVSISGNGPTLVPVTGDGKALPPLFWHDGRTAAPPLLPPDGFPPRSFFLPRAAWLRENAPGQYNKTRFFFSSHEWLAHRLGAEALTALPSAAYEPYYWNDEQCRLFGLDREKFPPFVKMGEVMGRVSKDAASLFGRASGNRLKSGTPIIAGGPDFITALIGTGTSRPGDVCDRAGSSEGVNVCAEQFRLAAPACAPAPASGKAPAAGNNVRILPHAAEGLWNVSVLINASGKLFEEYRNHAGHKDTSYEELLTELIPAKGDTNFFEGAFFFPGGENRAPPSPGGAALGRAVLCAIGFAVRAALETLADSGLTVKEMRVSGGQAKNARWNQLKADISGCSLLIPEIPDGELAGNAVLAAALLTGVSREEAADRMIRFHERYEPRGGASLFWKERYALYRREAEGAGK